MKYMAIIGAASLAACVHATPAHAASEQILYRFSGDDGANPYAGLVKRGQALYGTTYNGGKYGAGTVYRVTLAGRERVLHDFGSGQDGASTANPLIYLDGVFYGTTYLGGNAGLGTVFSLTPDGAETVLYSFQGGSDGAYGNAGLLAANDTLYGVTSAGGTGCATQGGCGTVFSITPGGTYAQIYAFKGALSDGANPGVPLIAIGNTLYSTTLYGGANNAGTVFSIGTDGTENVLYSFGGAHDGRYPNAPVRQVGHLLYTTTEYGGAFGNGAVARLTSAGKEHVAYAFAANGANGFEANSGLIMANGVLYGTTTGGGQSGCGGYGCGVVYALTKDGTQSVVYTFQGGNDGAQPWGELIYADGVLYGVTTSGGGTGCGGSGCGTVFAITP